MVQQVQVAVSDILNKSDKYFQTYLFSIFNLVQKLQSAAAVVHVVELRVLVASQACFKTVIVTVYNYDIIHLHCFIVSFYLTFKN